MPPPPPPEGGGDGGTAGCDGGGVTGVVPPIATGLPETSSSIIFA